MLVCVSKSDVNKLMTSIIFPFQLWAYSNMYENVTNGFDMDYIIVKQSNMEIQPNNPMKHHGTHSGYANPGHSFGEFFPNTRQKAILSQQLQDGIDFRGIF